MPDPYWHAEGATLYQGDAIEVLDDLPEQCVQTVVTSPPYYQLRNYNADGQIGLERTLDEHLARLCDVFDSLRRVLRDDGTVWMNYGDAYDDGQLGGLPWRVAFALQDRGWYLRSAIVWAKGVSFCDDYSGSVMPESVNGWRWERHRRRVSWIAERLPYDRDIVVAMVVESVHCAESEAQAMLKDPEEDPLVACPGCEKCCDGHGPDGYVLRKGSWRPTSAYEHIFMLAKSNRYFCDAERVREGLQPESIARAERARHTQGERRDYPGNGQTLNPEQGVTNNGRNPRNVWTIGTSGTSRKHYAAYPEALIEPCIQAATSQTACGVCGAPWAPVVEKETLLQGDVSDEKGVRGHAGQKPMDQSNGWQGTPRASKQSTVKSYRPTCKHDDDSGRCVVLDMFSGTGTSGVVALKQGCEYIGIDISEEYNEMARLRLRETLTGVSEDNPEQTPLFAVGE